MRTIKVEFFLFCRDFIKKDRDESFMSKLKSKQFFMELEVLYSQISGDKIQIIKNVLTNTYKDILKVYIDEEIELIDEAYTLQRRQYNAEILLNYLIRNKKRGIGLWVVSKDIYSSGMNFVFGLAQPFKGAILSIYRLLNKRLIEKEVVHEVGHVLGLPHCSNNCVMQYSNSLWEAEIKPSYLCEECKKKINLIYSY